MDEAQAFEAMAGALADRGLMTPEAIAQDRANLMARLNGEPEPAETPQSGGPTPSQDGSDSPRGQAGSVGVDPLDALAFAPPANAGAYNFGPPPQGVEFSPEQEAHFRGVFVAHEIPKPIGDQIGRLWNQAIVSPPTEAQLEQSYQEGHAALSRMWGADFQKNLAVANAEVDRMAKTNPEIKEMLRFSGLGNSPWLASTLYNLARARGRG